MRDLLLGRTPHDGDPATAAPSGGVEALFPSPPSPDRPGGTTFLLPGPEGLPPRDRLHLPRNPAGRPGPADLTVNARGPGPPWTSPGPHGGREDLLADGFASPARARTASGRTSKALRRACRPAARLRPHLDVRCCREFPFPGDPAPAAGEETWRASGRTPPVPRWVRLLGLRDPFPSCLPASAPPFLRRTCARTSDPVARAAAQETCRPDPPPAETPPLLGWPRGALRDLPALSPSSGRGDSGHPGGATPLRQASPEPPTRFPDSSGRRTLPEPLGHCGKAALRRRAPASRPSRSAGPPGGPFPPTSGKRPERPPRTGPLSRAWASKKRWCISFGFRRPRVDAMHGYNGPTIVIPSRILEREAIECPVALGQLCQRQLLVVNRQLTISHLINT